MRCDFTFSNCEDALKDIDAYNISADVILLDIRLPGMSGIEAIPAFREKLPATKIIILTIHDDNDNIFKAICAGASGYLLKDSSSDKILQSIEDVLNGGAPINIQIASKMLEMFRKFNSPAQDYGLSVREKEILEQLVEGYSKKEISNRLNISYHTVDMHMRKIYEKLEVSSRSGAVAKALKEKILNDKLKI